MFTFRGELIDINEKNSSEKNVREKVTPAETLH